MKNSFHNNDRRKHKSTKIDELTSRLKDLELEKAHIQQRLKEIEVEQRTTVASKVVKRPPPVPSKYIQFRGRVCYDCDNVRIQAGDRVEFITHAAHQPREGTVAYFTEYRVTVECDKGYKYSKESCSLKVVQAET